VTAVPVVVTFSPPTDMRDAIEELLGDVIYLAELPGDQRAAALSSADAVLAWNLGRELRDADEFNLLAGPGFVQLLSAGADHVPFDRVPETVTVASNPGAYADPMAEHVLAMALALAKRLLQNHLAMQRGEFDQTTLNRAIRGSVVGILGFGGIGQACARLFAALGARIHAINRSGTTDRPVEFIGPLSDLDRVLAAADVLVVSLPLTRETRGLIGTRELELMKSEAILVNVARAAILDEEELYEHLRRNPAFSAGIDAWWHEPLTAGSFTTRTPLLELPNVLGSPHNSGMTPGTLATAARDAAENLVRHLRGEPVRGLVDPADYVV
jgi:glycerate dehydrogenase